GIRDRTVTGVQTCALPISVSGDIVDGNLTGLRADVNLPLHDLSLTITPVDVMPVTTQQISVQWNRVSCDPFYGCSYAYGFSTFEIGRASCREMVYVLEV